MPHPVKTGFFENPLLNSQEAFGGELVPGCWLAGGWPYPAIPSPRAICTPWQPSGDPTDTPRPRKPDRVAAGDFTESL